MAITWKPIEEGAPLSADSLNGQFADVRSGINDLLPEYVKENTLHHKHLPSPIVEAKSAQISTAEGSHVYVNTYPGFGETIHSTFNLDSGFEVIAWMTVGDGYDAITDLSVTFDSPRNVSDPDIRGILIMANIQVRNIYDQGAATSVLGLPIAMQHAFFAIRVRTVTGHTVITASERYVHADTRNGTDDAQPVSDYGSGEGVVSLRNDTVAIAADAGVTTDPVTDSTLGTISAGFTAKNLPAHKDVPIRFFLDSGNADILGKESITGVEIVVSTSSAKIVVDPVVELGPANLSVIVLSAGGS